MTTRESLLKFDWYTSKEGKEILSKIFHRNTLKRKTEGLLDRPNVGSANLSDDINFKVFVSGRSSVGKTSVIAKLSGNPVPCSHYETLGIQYTDVYWPVNILTGNKNALFRLQLWDAGELAMKKFDHILPACREDVDGIIFVFSFIDKTSFDDIPNQISRLTDPDDGICKLVIGAKFDQHAHSEVTQRDVKDFEQNWKVPILKIRNLPDDMAEKGSLDNLAFILNTLCDQLWAKELNQARKSKPLPGYSPAKF